MKRILTKGALLLLATALLLLGSCKGKEDPKENNKEKKEAKITFQLSLPQGDAYTFRTTSTIIHDAEEYGIKKLTMYTFSADGSKLTSIDNIDMSHLVSAGEAKFAYTKTFTTEQVGIYRFLFVANDEISGAEVNSTSQEAFEKLLMSKTLNEGGTSKDILYSEGSTYAIPMTGVATQGVSREIAITGTTKPVKVVLTRVVARIDIANHIPNLTINKISLKNTYSKASLFPTKDANGNKTYQAPTEATKVSMSAGYADLPTPFKGEAGAEGKLLKKAFYLYEGQQPTTEAEKDKATTIVLEGQLENGQKVVYDIPFARTSATYSPLDVKRNFLYKLVLGDNNPIEPGSKIIFSIEDNPWNSILLNHELQIIKITSWNTEYETIHYEDLTRTLYTASKDKYPFTIETLLANHHDFTINMVSSTSGNTYTMTKETIDGKEKYMTDHLPNSNVNSKEKVVFEIASDAAPEIKRYLTIVYDKDYKNPNWKK